MIVNSPPHLSLFERIYGVAEVFSLSITTPNSCRWAHLIDQEGQCFHLNILALRARLVADK